MILLHLLEIFFFLIESHVAFFPVNRCCMWVHKGTDTTRTNSSQAQSHKTENQIKTEYGKYLNESYRVLVNSDFSAAAAAYTQWNEKWK